MKEIKKVFLVDTLETQARYKKDKKALEAVNWLKTAQVKYVNISVLEYIIEFYNDNFLKF